MPVTSIYLIRHAETTWNAERRLQGQLDAPLSERGVRQVRAIVRALDHAPLAAVYASPLRRAGETARPIAASHNLDVRVVDDLREIDQGEWESRLLDEVMANDGPRLQAWWDAPDQIRMPGGETLAEVHRRAMGAIEHMAAQHADQAIAVVAHGGVNKTILLSILGAPLRAYWRIRQHNACVNVLEFDGDQRRVLSLNDTLHLGGDAAGS
jgi:alpha-ribazole phosphatase